MSDLDVFAVCFMSFIGGIVIALEIATFITRREMIALARTSKLIESVLNKVGQFPEDET